MYVHTAKGVLVQINTAVRLLDPARAAAGVDGVFHPPYIDVHLGVAERLARPRLLVLKGGGGEAERVPAKPATAHLWSSAHGRSELALPAREGLPPAAEATDLAHVLAVWRGTADDPRAVATVQATLGLALLALGHAATALDGEPLAARLWAERRLA